MSHIRKISRLEAAAIRDAKAAEAGADLSAYAIGAMFNAVQVGETEADLYFDVNLSPAAALPGASLGGYRDLVGEDKAAILECRYRVTGPDPENPEGPEITTIVRAKEKDRPAGVARIEKEMIPHRFA
jgi:hypothetical protein